MNVAPADFKLKSIQFCSIHTYTVTYSYVNPTGNSYLISYDTITKTLPYIFDEMLVVYVHFLWLRFLVLVCNDQ